MDTDSHTVSRPGEGMCRHWIPGFGDRCVTPSMTCHSDRREDPRFQDTVLKTVPAMAQFWTASISDCSLRSAAFGITKALRRPHKGMRVWTPGGLRVD